MRSGTLTTVAALLALGLLGLGPVRPATARTEQLQLSLDGHRWFSRIERPLFDAARRWVPGDTETASVWVRTTTDAAGLTVGVVDRSPGSRFDEDFQLTLTANGRPLSGSAGYPVDPEDPVRIDVTVAFPAAAVSNTQRRRTDLALQVSLTQLAEDRPRRPDRRSELSATGATTLAGVLLVAGPLLLSVGAALIGARHRPGSPGREP